MEDSPILLLFLIIYLIAASSGSKKKGNKKKKTFPHPEKRRGPMRTRAQGEQLDWRSILKAQQTHQGFFEAFDSHEPQTEVCENRPIHLHEASQEKMMQAAEGEDPCHAGGSDQNEASEEVCGVWQDEAQNALAQDVLRGMVMSEILTRPQQRAALGAEKRQRRSHG